MKKKHSFTLIEILIAFCLAGILFTCIFSNFAQMSKLQVRLEKAHDVAKRRESFELQLRSLLARLPLANEKKENEKETTSPLYIADMGGEKGKGALWFSLTVDYDSDIRFIGSLSYCLYSDEKKRAVKLRVINSEGQEREEELLPFVKAVKISLFDPEKGSWVQDWPKNTERLPLFLKLEMDKVEFTFALPPSREPIIFEVS